jgi:hypothetical protein
VWSSVGRGNRPAVGLESGQENIRGCADSCGVMSEPERDHDFLRPCRESGTHGCQPFAAFQADAAEEGLRDALTARS